MWINPNADNTNQCKICPNCGQDNDRYGLPIYPFNKSTKVLNWCPKCLGTVEDITTVDRELPSADNVYVKSFGLGRQMAEIAGGINRPSFRGEPSRLLLNLVIKY